jgi:hypothetical protein
VEHQFFGSLDQRFNGIKSLDQGGSHQIGRASCRERV